MEKILVIEDNLAIRENLEEFLMLHDYQVSTAKDGEEGISEVYENTPDFIICDISMPKKNGYDVFEEVKDFIKTRKIPFIFLTASAQEKDIAEGKVSGADAYVVKPYKSDELLELIRKILNQT